MILTANGLPILAARLLRPRVGVWTLDLTVDPGADGIGLSGTVSVTLGALALAGTVHAGELQPDGTWVGRLVGGGGGLGRTIPALALRGCTLADVLGQTLLDAGEVLATGGAALTQPQRLWQRVEAPASRTVADVARAAGCDWRVEPDGTVWVGTDAWTVSTPSEVTLVAVHPLTQAVTVAGDTAVTIAPGTTLALDGWSPVRVGAVEVQADADAVRVVVYPEREGGQGRVLDALRALVRHMQPVDYFAQYFARVAAQTGNTLDLVPEDSRFAPCQAVPMRLGIPGVTVEVPVGARVLLGFEGGNPAAPMATLWEAGEVTKITINGGSTKVARVGDSTTAHTHTVVVDGVTYTTSPASSTISTGSDVLRVP